MRLSTEERLALKAHFLRELGADCDVLLFGSRVDDNQRGGDVDLLVRSPRPL
jgi:predicted nucleotidyltransferase